MGHTSVFHASMQKGRRVVIPRPICEALEIDNGDKVEITVKKVNRNGKG